MNIVVSRGIPYIVPQVFAVPNSLHVLSFSTIWRPISITTRIRVQPNLGRTQKFYFTGKGCPVQTYVSVLNQT